MKDVSDQVSVRSPQQISSRVARLCEGVQAAIQPAVFG